MNLLQERLFFNYFALRSMDWKRRISSAILLSVIVPMLVLAPYHHHPRQHTDIPDCDACHEHKPHSGHLTSQISLPECLVCQLLGVQFIPQTVPQFSLLCTILETLFTTDSSSCPDSYFSVQSPRAPPVSFCF